MFIPIVIEKTSKGEYNYDLYSKLLKDRIIFLSGDINEENSNLIVSQLLYLENENCELEINIYINSNGGSISCGFAIYDTINYIKCDVVTICLGAAYSMAAFILASGKKSKRYSLINSRIMIHQPLGGISGQASDIYIHAKEIKYLKKKLNKILSFNTYLDENFLKKITDRDFFMSPLKALEYKIIDYILISK